MKPLKEGDRVVVKDCNLRVAARVVAVPKNHPLLVQYVVSGAIVNVAHDTLERVNADR
jgi:hypothetical protein